MLRNQCLALAACLLGALSQGIAQESFSAPHPFNVKDDIAITQFGDIYRSPREDLIVSPGGRWCVAHTVSTSLERGEIHDSLLFYDVGAVGRWLEHPEGRSELLPAWRVDETSKTAFADAPLISQIRWLRDDTGIAFLVRVGPDQTRLSLAMIGKRQVTQLSPEFRQMLSFSVLDETHYVFTAPSDASRSTLQQDIGAPFRVGTGQSFSSLIFPSQESAYIQRAELWAADGTKPAIVKDRSTGAPIILYEDGTRDLTLSPNGKTVVTLRPVVNIPVEWESLYPPPFPNDTYRVRSGPQDLLAPFGWSYISEYVAIDLRSGKVTSLVRAPAALRAGWQESLASPSWSDDGRSVILPGTFLPHDDAALGHPCVVITHLAGNVSECVRPLHGERVKGIEPGYERIDRVFFASGHDDQIVTSSSDHEHGGERQTRYARTETGRWTIAPEEDERMSLPRLTIRGDIRTPPSLVATDPNSGRMRIVLDPNPQLRSVALGSPEIYRWTDGHEREWQGILYKPLGFVAGKRYPLVIQNHSYSIDRFAPSGGFPTAFVAQELASSGIMVLHVRDCVGRGTALEVSCNAEEYEAAIGKLDKEGLIDPTKVGIIGFSRTVAYVLQALTTGKIRYKAASITDGFNLGYLNYMLDVYPNSPFTNDQKNMIGTSPTGEGIARWRNTSPVFGLDRCITPVRVVAKPKGGLLQMWEPYAALEEMRRPVDLIVLNTDEHIVTNPAVRFAAQQGNVDWFRFWLQSWEDPDPVKESQYARWRLLRDGTR